MPEHIEESDVRRGMIPPELYDELVALEAKITKLELDYADYRSRLEAAEKRLAAILGDHK